MRPRRSLHPETVAEIRRRNRRAVEDLPDEAVERLFVAAHVSLGLHMRDLGRALRAALPVHLRRLFGETAHDSAHKDPDAR